jgi:hypothetical protein
VLAIRKGQVEPAQAHAVEQAQRQSGVGRKARGVQVRARVEGSDVAHEFSE